MSTCTFFGHKDCEQKIKPKLKKVLEELITQKNVDIFLVGNQGGFDNNVKSVLQELKAAYPKIQYSIVLAYMPKGKNEYDDDHNTLLPEGIENIHPRFAISWRNDWMLRKSDYVISYINHDWGGAAKYVSKAIKSGKTVINLGELTI